MIDHSPAVADHIDFHNPGVWTTLEAFFSEHEAVLTGHYGIIECNHKWRWYPKLFDFDLWIPLSGSGVFQLCGINIPINPGYAFLLRPGDIGHARQTPGNNITVVYAHFSFYHRKRGSVVDMNASLLPKRHIYIGEASRLSELMTSLARLKDSSAPLNDAERRLLLTQALIEVYRADAAQDRTLSTIDARLNRILVLLRTHPAERLSLEAAAAICGLSPRYFSRLFTSQIGMAYREFCVRIRLQRAKELLEESTLRIGEIASSLGYYDIFLFNRQFKQAFGTTPSQVRLRSAATLPDVHISTINSNFLP